MRSDGTSGAEEREREGAGSSEPTPVVSASGPVDIDATADLTGGVDATSESALPSPDAGSLDSSRDVPQLVEPLGRGGNAEVLLGVQASLAREVAIKRLLPERRTAPGRSRLVEEARLAGKLEHPNIVPIHDLRTDAEGWPYLVMKRVQGRTWKRVIAEDRDARGRLADDALERHLRTLVSVCHAVHFAHTRGVVHCDLKPSNVMLGEFGEVYVVDWGSALALDPASGHVRLPPGSSVRGTAHYLAPELARAAEGSTLDGRVDVYALGVVLAELLLGRVPHATLAPEEVLARRPAGVPDALVERAGGEAGTILRRALASDPASRHPSVEALRHDVEAFLDHRAARSLGVEARERLARLDTLATDPRPESLGEIDNVFAECRFACRESLRRWPEQPDVLETLDEAYTVMTEIAIERGNVHGAIAHLRGIRKPAASLVSRVDDLARRRSLDARELAELRNDAVQRDITAASPVRRRAMVLGGLFALPVVLLAPEVLGYELDYVHLVAGTFAFFVGLGLVVWRLRSKLFVNHATRALIGLMFLESGLALAVVLGGAATGLGVIPTLASGFLALFAANATAAWLAERRFAIAGVMQLLAALLIVARPDVAGIVWLTTVPLSLAVTGFFRPAPFRGPALRDTT